ncbi:7297_t:CDS:2, partial [Acaulospora morrowiae]
MVLPIITHSSISYSPSHPCTLRCFLPIGANNVTTETDELVTIGQTFIAVWVKVVSSWVCFALYIWTLAGPVFMPSRFG